MGATTSKRQCSLFSSPGRREEEKDPFDDAVENLPSNDSFDKCIGAKDISSSLTETIKNGMRDKNNDGFSSANTTSGFGGEKKSTKKKAWLNPHKQNTPEFIEYELKHMPVGKMYPDLVDKATEIVKKWKVDFPLSVWTRTVKGDRVAKEFNESAPVIARMLKFVDEEFEKPENEGRRITIVDLCSGFGYLGMFLSELLDPEKVRKIYLIDKEWPQFGAKPKENRMSNAHIVGPIIENSTKGTAMNFNNRMNMVPNGSIQRMVNAFHPIELDKKAHPIPKRRPITILVWIGIFFITLFLVI